MDALTDPGVQPVSQPPVSPCGFYPKQDSVRYFSTPNPSKSGFGSYPAYPTAAEGDSWTSNQKMVQHPYMRQPIRNEAMQDERRESSRPYIPPPNTESNPLTSAVHHQIHQSQLQTSLPSSLSPYPHGHPSPLSRDVNQKKYTEDNNSSCDDLRSFYSSQKVRTPHGSMEPVDFPRPPDYRPVQNDKVNVTYDYKKQNINGRFIDDNYRSMYFQHFRDTPQNIKTMFNNDTPGVISYSKSRATPVIPQEKSRDPGECGVDTPSAELRESANMMTAKHYHRDFDRRQNFAMTSDHNLYRKEMEHPENSSTGKLTDCYNDRDKTSHIINHQNMFEEKVNMAEGFSKAMKNKLIDTVQHSVQNSVTSLSQGNQEEPISHQHYPAASPRYFNQSPVALDVLRSPTSQSAQPENLNDSTLYGSTAVKSESPSSIADHKFSKDPPSLPWMTSSSPTVHHPKQTQKDSFNEDYGEQKHSSKDPTEIMEPSNSDGHLSERKMLPRIMSPSQPVHNSEGTKSPGETPKRLSPSPRYSNDGYAKLNSSDSCEDGSLDAKREVFSDDAEDDSICEESTSHSPGFSPFHDASAVHPHHFTHPFFPSQAHGPIPGFKFPFGSFQGHHDSATGYPFRHMSGVPQDMALVGHMRPARPSFMGSVGPGIDPLRQMAGENDIYFCHLCSYSGKSKPEFDSHMNTHFEFNCPHCDYTSRTEGRLKRHVKDFHSDDSSRRSMPGRPKIYKCKQCQFLATDKDAFWAHSRTHIKEDKLLQCPQCPFVTEYKHHLEYHLRNHFGSKPFKCPKCNYSCVNKSMLNSHMKSHTNVYQYRCSDCTYATKYCHSLKLHLKKYNHKPATVLNQDGSLPQGLDVETSGLSIVSKRGPPRGPRGTRKDKPEPYLNHLFEMPQMPLGVAGMNPILNGILPFWPMLPQMGLPGHPSHQSGMLAGVRNIVQQIGIRADHIEKINSSKIDFINDISEKSYEDSKKYTADKAKICRMCGFVAETREALGLHFMQLHKEEAKEVAKSYGLSETFLTESFKKIIPEAKLEQQPLEELQQSDSDEDDGETHSRKSDADFHQKEHGQSLQFTSGQKEESSKIPQASWSPISSENYDGRSRPSNMHYTLEGVGNSQHKDDNGGSNTEIDILQQMTLKFGMGVLTDNKRSSANDEDQMLKKELDEVKEPTSDLAPRVSQTPLDLTKPKSVSPPILSDSPKQFDGNDHAEEEERMSNSDFEVISNPGEVSSNLVQSEKLLKRLLRENDDSTNMNSPAAEMLIAPRKRSRKGKAYKWDTLCLKLQRRHSSTSHDEENDECDTDMDSSFHDTKPHETNEESAEKHIDQDDYCINSDGKLWKNRSLNSPHNPVKDSQYDYEDVEMAEVTAQKSENERVDNNDINTDLRPHESINCVAKKSQQNKNIHEESDLQSENRMILQEEAELELQKLHTSLHVLKQSLASDNSEIIKSEICVDNNAENTVSKDYKNSEMVCENQSYLDNKINSAATSNSQSLQKPLEGDKVDQVEMINTVIENRKKPLPPAVRRGTDLAWKLLNDPVHPVTTLPLPLETLPSPRPSKTPSLPHSTAAMLPELVNISAATRKDSKPHPLSPQYSQPLHLNVPQPHHPNSLHATHTTQPHHKHPSLHPHASQIHHPHVQSSLMSMKSLMSIPLPSTPMAYIPPTNRMMSEPNTASNTSRMKHVQKDLYECTYCDLSFRDCVMYTVHMGYHSNQNPFQCNSCGVVSRDKVEFFLHIARSPHV